MILMVSFQVLQKLLFLLLLFFLYGLQELLLILISEVKENANFIHL